MSTVHLTPEEKKINKSRKAEYDEVRRKNMELGRLKAKANRDAKKLEYIEKAKAENPDILKFLGPAAELDPAFAPMVLDQFVEGLSKQPNFLEVVGEDIENPKIAKFLKFVGEPGIKSMTDCAHKAGLTQKELAQVWRDRKASRAFFRIVNRLEEQVDKVVDDAMGKKKACRRCDGLKRIEVPESMREFFEGHETAICPECDGVGFTLDTGSAQHAQLVWEKMGWSKAKGGISVNLNMGDHMADATLTELDGIEGQIVDI